MPLKNKILIIVVGVFIGFAVLDYGVLRLSIYPSFEAHERSAASEDIRRITDATSGELDHLDRTCLDWSAWNDTYRFAADSDPDYIESNLQPATFEDNRIDIIVVLGKSGTIIWGGSFDRVSGKWLPSESFGEAVGWVTDAAGSYSTGDVSRGLKTILPSRRGLLMIAARPILRSDKTGPALGWMIFGRLIDSDLHEQLAKQTGVDFRLSTGPPAPSAALNHNGKKVFSVARPLAVGSTQPLWVTVSREAVFIGEGQKVLTFSFFSLMTAGLMLIIVLLGLLQRTVLTPLLALTAHAKDLSATGDLTKQIKWQRGDEFGVLSRTIDTMVARLREKTAALVAANSSLSRDIIERRAIEKRMARSQQMFETISESARDVIIIMDHDGRILFWSKAGKSVLGYSELEVIGKDLHLLLAPDRFHDAYRAGLKQFKATGGGPAIGRTQELVAVHKDGRTLPVELSLSALEQDNRLQAVGVLRDITDRVKAEEERRMLAAAVGQSPEVICITDAKFAIVYINPAFTALTGITASGADGRTVFDLVGIDEHTRDAAGILSSVRAGRRWRGQVHLAPEDGHRRTVEALISPVTHHRQGAMQWIFLLRDITAELEKENQFRQAQKMEAIGALAGGIAHDFNNILSGIIGYTELAAQDPSLGNHGRQCLQKVLKAGSRATDLVKQILTFSRQGDQELKPLSLSPIIREALKLLRASLPATIQIYAHVLADCAVIADATQIHQIIMNLCTNARQGIGEKPGRIEISLGETEYDRAVEYRGQILTPGRYARLTVADDGRGIPEALRERIFDPFFTTKRKGEGTGLGLSVVRGIVTGMGGGVMLEDQPEKGACFTILLPAIDAPVEKTTTTVSELPRGTGRILVVDDEPFQTDMIAQMLKALGYSVSTVNDSTEAFELFSGDADAFDLIVTDMTMPNLTGDILAIKCMEIRPDIPIALCTGFSEYITEGKAERLGIRAFLMKPVVYQELAETVHRLIIAEKSVP